MELIFNIYDTLKRLLYGNILKDHFQVNYDSIS